ncbi:MAG: PfkB family carbohydrate kinase [Oscillospiraceae bacterium]|nr:PfkB family carbohydrate kinase [Oscillospiraceae bacterium]
MEPLHNMTGERLCEILKRIENVRAAIFGDLCLDVYWHADMRMSELSRETPHFPMPVVEERISPGGGANVAANMAALKPGRVMAAGTAGRDWRGRELFRLMEESGVISEYIVREAGLVTNAFCKPLRKGISAAVYEDPRLDFANTAPLGEAVEDALITALDALAPQVDILCISDQLPANVYGAVTERVRGHILKLARNGLTVAADSRDRIGLYRDMILKPNEVEGARAAGMAAASGLRDYAEAASVLSRKQACAVIMTVGANGSLYAADGTVTHIPAHPVTGEIDIVGAGDSFLSGFSLALAAGASRLEAAFFAGLCSEVVIQKIGTTGTASPEEILERYHQTRSDKP